MKLNIGCGNHPIDGYINIDKHSDASDWKCDFWDITSEHPEVLQSCSLIRMDHVLEHFSWRQTDRVIDLISRMLNIGGEFIVEVPNMSALLSGDFGRTEWQQAIFGSQSNDGEYHLSGFTSESLIAAVQKNGMLKVESLQVFKSTHPARRDYPCLLAEAKRVR